jgi:acylphosphatase
VTTEPARLEVVVRGGVQGVGYRYFAWREAMALDLAGWVANESDGSVRCLAQGPREQLEAFLDILRAGPPAARVTDVHERWGPAGGDLGPFSVRSGSHRGD